jgi:acyl carrier protein
MGSNRKQRRAVAPELRHDRSFSYIWQAHKMKRESTAAYDVALEKEVAALIVQALNLDVAADSINPDDPLYGDGLGLDSIDVLEVALLISKQYGLQLRANNEDNHRIFSSLRNLTEYISAQRSI